MGSTVIGTGGGDDAATLARIALERLERGDLEAVAAMLRVDGVGELTVSAFARTKRLAVQPERCDKWPLESPSSWRPSSMVEWRPG